MQKKYTPAYSKETMENVAKCYLLHRSIQLTDGLKKNKEIFDSRDPKKFKDFVIDYNHQGRIDLTIKQAAIKLVWEQLDRLASIEDFEQLLSATGDIIMEAGIKNGFSLWAYDLALRIGYSRSDNIEEKVLPEKIVYNFNGAHRGAKKWFKEKRISHRIAIENFKEIIPILENAFPEKYVSMHIENLLCHCPKDCLYEGFEVQAKCPCNKGERIIC